MNLPATATRGPSVTYDLPVPADLLAVLRRWATTHGFSVNSPRMSAALPLAIYTQHRECWAIVDGTAWPWHFTQAPQAATGVHSVHARIRYPGSEQPSPGSPYFLVAKVGGVWQVVRSVGVPDEWGG